jgi:hypothetical protein
MAKVALKSILVDSVGRVTLRAANALALSKSQPLTLLLSIDISISPNANYTKLSVTLHAVGHPLHLINKLKVFFLWAT